MFAEVFASTVVVASGVVAAAFVVASSQVAASASSCRQVSIDLRQTAAVIACSLPLEPPACNLSAGIDLQLQAPLEYVCLPSAASIDSCAAERT